MRYYPIVALANGRYMVAAIEGTNAEDRAARLVQEVNRHAGDAVVKLGKPFESDVTGVFYVGERVIPVNPSYAFRRDPNRLQLSGIVADARTAAVTRAAKAKATGAAKSTGTGTRAAKARGTVKAGANA